MKEWVTITGSSNGIGAALAEIFAREGHSIILHGRNRLDLSNMHNKITSYGVQAKIVEGDILSPKTLENLINCSKENNFGILVNNVGYRCPFLTLDEISDEQINDMIEINLKFPIKIAREAYKYFINKGSGCIINMNSIVGIEPRKQRSIYTATRAGLSGFTESLRLEAKEHKVRVIGIYPARVKTKPEFEYGWDVKDAAEKMYKLYASGNSDNLILDFSKSPLLEQKTYSINGEAHIIF